MQLAWGFRIDKPLIPVFTNFICLIAAWNKQFKARRLQLKTEFCYWLSKQTTIIIWRLRNKFHKPTFHVWIILSHSFEISFAENITNFRENCPLKLRIYLTLSFQFFRLQSSNMNTEKLVVVIFRKSANNILEEFILQAERYIWTILNKVCKNLHALVLTHLTIDVRKVAP